MSTHMEWSIDGVGWCSAPVVLLVAYTLVSTRRVEGDSVFFQALNISKAALLSVNTFYWGAPSLTWSGSGLEDTHCIDGKETYQLPINSKVTGSLQHLSPLKLITPRSL